MDPPWSASRQADDRWQWKGTWTEETIQLRGVDTIHKTASEAGAEASVTFTGTGAIMAGPFLPTGGKADVFVDGELDRTVDANSDEAGSQTHRFHLASI